MSNADIGTPCTWCQGPIDPKRARLASHGVNRFCSDKCSRRHANSLISKGQREEWAKAPNQICQVPGCGKTFKPTFGSNWMKQIACQDCVGTRVYRRWMSKRSRNRHKKEAQVIQANKNLKEVKPRIKRRCRSAEKRDGFQSPECKRRRGLIPIYRDHEPWDYCDDCQSQYMGRKSKRFADLVINFEPIDLAESCIL